MSGRRGEDGKGRDLNATFPISCRLTANCMLPTANLMTGVKELSRRMD